MEEAHPDFLLQRERNTEHLTCDMGKKKTRSLPEDTRWLELLLPQEETREGSCPLSVKTTTTRVHLHGVEGAAIFFMLPEAPPKKRRRHPRGARCDSSPGRGAVASRSAPAPVSQGSWRWAGFRIHDASKEDPGGVYSLAPCTAHWTPRGQMTQASLWL